MCIRDSGGAWDGELERHHRAMPANIPDLRMPHGELGEPVTEGGFDAVRVGEQGAVLEGIEHGVRGGDGYRVPPKVLPSPPGPAASMMSARPVTPDSGRPAAICFAVRTMSGTSPSLSLANQVPVRPSPHWISSAISTTPFACVHCCNAGR